VGTGGAIESVPIPDHIRQLLGPAPGSA
jgi:hypothetical protein